MESTSDQVSALKRDLIDEVSNIGYDSGDTDNASMEGPRRKKGRCHELSRKKTHIGMRSHTTTTTNDQSFSSNTEGTDSNNSSEEDIDSIGDSHCTKTTTPSPAPINNVAFDEAFNNFTIPPEERTQLIADYKKVMARFDSPEFDVQGINEIKKTLSDLQPMQDVICLYVRFARQLPSNFNIDSICSLLCISKQCNYKPYIFLTKVKTLEVRKTPSSYGISFWFYTRNTKDVDGVLLEKKFLGLKYTLKLLQSTIATSQAILGRVGMRQRGKRQPMMTQISIGDNNLVPTTVTPSIEFHKHSSLVAKLWLGINHRWLAYHIVEHLFLHIDTLPLSTQQIFVYSIQMFTPCGRSRYDFLNPLVGLCIRFKDHVDIEANNVQLRKIWDNPSLFYSFGNSCLQEKTKASRVQLISDAFAELKNTLTRKSLYRSLPLETQWTILRVYAFHFWLDQAKNETIKSSVLKILSQEKKSTPPTISTLPSKENDCQVDDLIDRRSFHQKPGSHAKLPSQKNANGGLKLLLESRKKSNQPPTSKDAPRTNDCSNKGPTCIVPDPTYLSEYITNHKCNWNNFRLLTTDELENFLASFLIIRRDDGVDIVSRLAAFEVYSADHLHKLKHCRLNRPPQFYPTTSVGQVVLNIGSTIDEYIDVGSKSFHLAREGSSMFKEHGKLLPSISDFANLCRAVICHGAMDSKRSQSQKRAFIGNGGQDHPHGVPTKIVDGGFMQQIKQDPTLNLESLLQTIGRLSEFLWKTISDLQTRANDSPLAPDRVRHSAYSKHLCDLLSMHESVSFEDITLVVSAIFPLAADLDEHVDAMNDSVIGYTRTGTLSICFMIEDDTDFRLGLQLQVIGNFRRIIRQYMVPFTSALEATVRHAKEYLDKWEKNMNMIFGGRGIDRPNPFSREWFYLDDSLPYKRVQIYKGSRELGKEGIHGEYLLCQIGLSRVLSKSMFINQIRRTQAFLKFDQWMELAFACSLLSNPFWFDTVMDDLIAAHQNISTPFTFGLHPFFDWLTATIDKFGSWQGGPYNRWSPCGGDKSIPQAFGHQTNSTSEEQSLGQFRLRSIMHVLYHHVLWVDSLATHSYSNPVDDLHISNIKLHMEQVCKQIYKIVPCQFNLFRLSIFNTIMTGLGAFQPGHHLKQLMFPIRGSASYKHLESPLSDVMSREVAVAICGGDLGVADPQSPVNIEHHDRLMQYLCTAVGRQTYVRDEIECLLCESHPNRDLQNCCDWFRQNQTIYDCLDDGQVIEREYGRSGKWKVITRPMKKEVSLAYIQLAIAYIGDDPVLREHADNFGDQLRDTRNRNDITFEGRMSRTSDGEQYYGNNYSSNRSTSSHYCYKVANFYDKEFASTRNIRTMKVLGHMEKAQVLETQANPFQSFCKGLDLMSYLGTQYGNNHQLGEMRAATYHKQIACDSQSKSIVFDGHVDKSFVHTAWFIPLTVRPFYTFIAVPSTWNITRDPASENCYNQWMASMSTEERTQLGNFRDNFLRSAKLFMKTSDIQLLTFKCSVGTFLSFPANLCYHATITVNLSSASNGSKNKFRDLLIVYPMIEGG